MKVLQTSIFLFFLSLLSPCQSLTALPEDVKSKDIIPFNLSTYKTEVDAMNEAINASGDEETVVYDSPLAVVDTSSDVDWEMFFLPPVYSAAQEAAFKKEAEERQKRDLFILQEFAAQLKAIKPDTLKNQAIEVFRKSFKERKEDTTIGDVIMDIAVFFDKSGHVELAKYFYDLSIEGGDTPQWAQSCCGRMFLNLYNREIIESNPRKPTPSLLDHLNKLIKAMDFAYYCGDEEAYLISIDAKKRRDAFIRWHIAPAALEADLYYGKGRLMAKAYHYEFMKRFLVDAQLFYPLTQCNVYTDTLTQTGNLLDGLRKLGFVGINKRVFVFADEQHIWAHPNGYMVRIKRTSSTTGRPEFTIGMVMQNPVEWDRKATPSKAIKLAMVKTIKSDFEDAVSAASRTQNLATFQYNEVFKLAYVKGTVFLIPAFRDTDCIGYWYERSSVTIDEMMRYAHFPLRTFSATKTYLTF